MTQRDGGQRLHSGWAATSAAQRSTAWDPGHYFHGNGITFVELVVSCSKTPQFPECKSSKLRAALLISTQAYVLSCFSTARLRAFPSNHCRKPDNCISEQTVKTVDV